MIFDRKKAYSAPTDAEKREKEDRAKKGIKDTQEARDAAVKCLESDLFHDYYQKLLKGREAILDAFSAVDESDMQKEWKIFKELQCKLHVLENLLIEVTKDAMREIPKEKP